MLTLSCQARGLRNQNIPTKLRLTYFQDRSLTLDLQYQTEDSWTNCFTVDAPKLPNVAYLGFSAETGELADNHDIISVVTHNLYGAQKGQQGEKTYPAVRQREKRKGGGWGWFFFKFVVFGLVVTGAYVGFTMYRANSRRSRF